MDQMRLMVVFFFVFMHSISVGVGANFTLHNKTASPIAVRPSYYDKDGRLSVGYVPIKPDERRNIALESGPDTEKVAFTIGSGSNFPPLSFALTKQDFPFIHGKTVEVTAKLMAPELEAIQKEQEERKKQAAVTPQTEKVQ